MNRREKKGEKTSAKLDVLQKGTRSRMGMAVDCGAARCVLPSPEGHNCKTGAPAGLR